MLNDLSVTHCTAFEVEYIRYSYLSVVLCSAASALYLISLYVLRYNNLI